MKNDPILRRLQEELAHAVFRLCARRTELGNPLDDEETIAFLRGLVQHANEIQAGAAVAHQIGAPIEGLRPAAADTVQIKVALVMDISADRAERLLAAVSGDGSQLGREIGRLGVLAFEREHGLDTAG